MESLGDGVLTGRYGIFAKSAPVGSWNTFRSNSGIIARMWSKMSAWIAS